MVDIDDGHVVTASRQPGVHLVERIFAVSWHGGAALCEASEQQAGRLIGFDLRATPTSSGNDEMRIVSI